MRQSKTVRLEDLPITASIAADQVPAPQPETTAVGKIHNIGKRSAQQDSFGLCPVPRGVLAVLADGMGGLASGDVISQKVVLSMLSQVSVLQTVPFGAVLGSMLRQTNREINQMLNPEGQYVSGSTLVAVLIQERRFHWISVGDSRIYLYRGGSLIQLNREHTYGRELLRRAVNGEISVEEAETDPQRNKITSFIGMGQLKYVDISLRSLELCAGDRLLLMSDGMFNTLSERQMVQILKTIQDPVQVAAEMESQVLAAGKPHQDNFSALIIGF